MPINTQATKWDKKYQNQVANISNDELQGDEEVSFVLAQNQHLLPPSGEALDLACGLGADAFFLERAGLRTSAYDISQVAVQYLRELSKKYNKSIDAVCFDIESTELGTEKFDVISVSRFLHRPSCEKLVKALKPGGLLFYQTFTRNKLNSGGPSNPEYLLQQRELLELFASLSLCFYREDDLTGYSCDADTEDQDFSHIHSSHIHRNHVHRNYAYYVGQKPQTAK